MTSAKPQEPGGLRTPPLVQQRSLHASSRTPRTWVALGYAVCCVLWGSTWMVVKLGLQDLPPLHFAAARWEIVVGGLLVLFSVPLANLRGGGRVKAAP